MATKAYSKVDYIMHQGIGILGLLLPTILIIYGLNTTLLPTISDYYHSIFRDYFVGTLFTVGFFFFMQAIANSCFSVLDRSLYIAVFITALGVGLFSTSPDVGYIKEATQPVVGSGIAERDAGAVASLFKAPEIPGWAPEWHGKAHNICAGILFFLFGFIAIFRFPILDGSDETADRTYQALGILIWLFLGVTIWALFQLEDTVLVIFLEGIMLYLFAFAWLVKGDVRKRSMETMASLRRMMRQ